MVYSFLIFGHCLISNYQFNMVIYIYMMNYFIIILFPCSKRHVLEFRKSISFLLILLISEQP
jgi:hypothetical protein